MTKPTTTRRTPRPQRAREAGPSAGPRAILPAEYARRRLALRERFPHAVIVLEGNTEGERGELRSGFFQDPSFLYLTGYAQPGATLVLAPADHQGPDAETLLLPDQDSTRTLWSGSIPDATGKLTAKLLPRQTGLSRIARRCSLESTLTRLLSKHEKLACLAGSATEARLRQSWPLREILPIGEALGHLRMRKSAAEIGRLREAIRITIEGQLRGWRSLQTSLNEYEVAADITHEFLRLGAERHAFAPIVAGGANACVLHYSRNRAPLRKGTLAILDLGAEREHYAGDLTRTIPIGGRFTRRQRELYEAVLAVQNEVIAAIKPGAFLGRQIPGGLHQMAIGLLASIKLGPKGKPLSDYFPHGIGHHLGLDVHDAADPLAPLAPGMVVTVEPGVYLPEEGIGIRIEDDVLVTADGCDVLSSALPKEPEALEAIARA